MRKSNPDRPRRREPYHYDATSEQYAACIRQALNAGRVPLNVLRMVYAMLLPYMHADGPK